MIVVNKRVIVVLICSLLAFGLAAFCVAKANSETAQAPESTSTYIPVSASVLAEPASAPPSGTWVYALIFLGVGIALASLALTLALRLRHKQDRQFSISET